MKAKRAIIRLQLDREAKEALDELCQRRGMTQIAALSRLVRWFSRQDEVIQSSVLGGLSDESLRVLAERLLARIVRGDGPAAPNPVMEVTEASQSPSAV